MLITPPAIVAPQPTVAAPMTIAASTEIVPGDRPRSIKTAFAGIVDAVRGAFDRRPDAPLPTAGPVDLARYAGLWYELARMPTRFQDPKSVSTAEYTVRPDGKVGVQNTAYVGDKRSAQISGTATVADGAANDRLRVRFGGLLKFIPVAKQGNYWVIDLKDDYSMALVGTPDRSNLWLLSRDPKAWDTAEAARMVSRATELGFDTDKLLVADWDKRIIR